VTAATVDAVRKAAADDPREPPPPETTETTPTPDEQLRARVAGELVVVGADTCRVRTFRLPGLMPGRDEPGCGIDHSSPRPDGAAHVGRAELERAALRHPNVPGDAEVDVSVEDLVWLGRTRAVARLDVTPRGRLARLGPQPVIAVFESGRVVHTTSLFRTAGARLIASPTRRYVAFAPGIVLRRDGSEATVPPHLVHAHAVAWSPDGRWLALAQRAVVVLVDVESLERYDREGGSVRTVTLPLFARDLAWRMPPS
jgi:hypothetical protein